MQYGKNQFGTISICELFDEWRANPLFNLKLFSYLPCRVLSTDSLSARPSLLNDKHYAALTGTTIEFKKVLGHEETRLDFRSRIARFGAPGVTSQAVLLGYVTSVGPSGAFIALGQGLVARANPNQLSDTQSTF